MAWPDGRSRSLPRWKPDDEGSGLRSARAPPAGPHHRGDPQRHRLHRARARRPDRRLLRAGEPVQRSRRRLRGAGARHPQRLREAPPPRPRGPAVPRPAAARQRRPSGASRLAGVEGEHSALGAAGALRPPRLVHRLALPRRRDGRVRAGAARRRLAHRLAFLEQADWKYEGSRAGPSGGGRTHTFGLRHPASRLRECAVYARSDVALRGGKPGPANGGAPLQPSEAAR